MSQTLVDGLTFPEAPRWRDERLWFSDFYTHRVLAVDTAGRLETIATVPQRPSGLGWTPDGALLVVSMLDRRLLRFDGTGAHVAAEAHHTEQLLHGHLAAVDPSARCFVLEGEGRAAQRAVDAMRALGELGCDALLVPTTHPVVDIVRFQLLACDLADARGIDPDMIRWDEEPWDRARQAQDWTAPTDQ